MIKGQVISGELGKVLVRQKAEVGIEVGELLIAEKRHERILLQVYDLQFGSQISQQNLELVSGMHLEEEADFSFMDPHLRNYTLALAKPLLWISKDKTQLCKSLPGFFSSVRQITSDDLHFLGKPEKSLFVGRLRSGSEVLPVDIFLPGEKVLSHHILIAATTGRGKSNLTSVMLWDCVDKDYCGVLVLDPHDEYYGRTGIGLRNHPRADNVTYYSPRPPAGGKTLRINMSYISPDNFNGVMYFSDPQRQALQQYHRYFGARWIEALLREEKLEGVRFFPETLAVVKRKLVGLLDVTIQPGNSLKSNGIFDFEGGQSTIPEVCQELESGKTVIIDTSLFSGSIEILVGSLIASEVYKKYKSYKMQGVLKDKPNVSIVLEEAPRVLGKEVLEKGHTIFSTIAREGRKFKVGLTAITQLPSLIPREILANMNTKIILGIEMGPERQAIIESASQDLSTDARTIASLDKGEALITSNFAKCALPVKIPLFSDVVKESKKESVPNSFSGVTLN